LVRGGRVTPISGDWNPERIVIVEFDDMDQLQKCMFSPEYTEIAPIREEAAISKVIVVEGIR